MKKLLLLPLLFLFLNPQNAKASHVAGAELYYEYIGDSTGIPFHYEITLVLYRDGSGAGLGSQFYVDMQSSCGNSAVTVQQYTPQGATPAPNGGIVIENYTECSSSSANLPLLEAHYYKGTTVLPGKCVYTFSWNLCCRNGSIQNLDNPSSYNLYVESLLDNTYEPNSSPVINAASVKAFCTGFKMKWPQTAREAEGDSLHYTLSQPLDGPGSPIPFVTGYSAGQPMTTHSGMHLNPNNGQFSFTPVVPEMGVMKILVEDFRYDTIADDWRLVGTTSRDMQFVVTQTCDSSTAHVGLAPVTLDSNQNAVLACNEKYIEIEMEKRVDCTSIASDGSDFGLTNSLGTLIPIVEAGTDNCKGSFTKSLWLRVHDSLYYNDTLTLVTRVGNDTNTVVNACGMGAPANDSLSFVVQGCTTSVALQELELPALSLYPNPATETLMLEFASGSSNRKVQIISMQGKVMRSEEAFQSRLELDVSALPNGLYLLRSIGENAPAATTFQKL